MSTNVIVDVSNIVWATRFSEFKKSTGEFSKDLLLHCVISTMIHNTIKFGADGILMAFDGRNTWRRKLYPEYKAHRERDMFYDEVLETIDNLKTFFSANTDLTCISVEGAEADDVIKVATELSEKSIIISSDKDFIQLTGPNTRLYASTLDLERTSEDVAYDLYIKCIRGDSGDNIKSAYPRIRETKLKAAWEDPVAMANLMETVLPDGRKVADAYEFNRTLIDLNRIPPIIQADIVLAIMQDEVEPKKYSQMAILGTLGRIGLRKLAQELGNSNGFYQKKFIVKKVSDKVQIGLSAA